MKNIETQYLELCQEILDKGNVKQSRIGNSKSLFGRELKHNFIDTGFFPLYTTKKVSLKTVFTELKWMLLGRSDLRWLLEHDCKIWVGDCYVRYCKYTSDNSSTYNEWMRDNNDGTLSMFTEKEFIQKILTDSVFSEKWGNMGQIYGKQMRDESYDDEGGRLIKRINGNFDQIDKIINLLKTDPDSRRMVCSMWNVKDLQFMLLEPCHYSFQVYTRELRVGEIASYCKTNKIDYLLNESLPERAISLKLNLRSNDLPIGNPYNLPSYAMLLLMLAKQVNMIPEELICSIGDAHIYENQIEGVKEQLTRTSFQLPTLSLNDRKVDDISEYEFDDFTLTNYKHHSSIKIPLSN